MFARITFVQVKPQDIDDASRLFDESVVPAVRQEQGFRGALLLVRDTGEALAVDFAESLEDLQANERNGVYQAQVAKFRERIIGHPRARSLPSGSREGTERRSGTARGRRRLMSLPPGSFSRCSPHAQPASSSASPMRHGDPGFSS